MYIYRMLNNSNNNDDNNKQHSNSPASWNSDELQYIH